MKRWGKRFYQLAVFMLVFILWSQAFADQVMDEGGMTLTGAPGLVVGHYLLADDFFVDTSTWTDVHFWTFEDETLPPSTIRFYLWSGVSSQIADATQLLTGALSPATYTRTKMNDDVMGTWDSYQYDFNISPFFTLEAGTPYWLGVQFGTTYLSSSTYQGWEYVVPGTGAHHWYYYGPTSHWTQQTGATHAPEPATMILLGSGLIGLAGLVRKFKK